MHTEKRKDTRNFKILRIDCRAQHGRCHYCNSRYMFGDPAKKHAHSLEVVPAVGDEVAHQALQGTERTLWHLRTKPISHNFAHWRVNALNLTA